MERAGRMEMSMSDYLRYIAIKDIYEAELNIEENNRQTEYLTN